MDDFEQGYKVFMATSFMIEEFISSLKIRAFLDCYFVI